MLPPDTLFADARSGYIFYLAQLQAAIGGGGSDVTLNAATELAAGTSVSVDGSGGANQTWGPAPDVDGLVTLLNGANIGTAQGYDGVTLVLSPSKFVVWGATNSLIGAQACSVDADGTITPGPVDTSTPSIYVSTDFHILQDGVGGTFLGTGGNPTAAALSANTFLAAYNDGTNSNSFTVAVGSVDSDNNITYGTPVVVDTTPLGDPHMEIVIVVLSATSFALVYAASDSLIAAGSIVGTDITVGTPVSLSGANNTLTAGMLTSTSVLVGTVVGGVSTVTVASVVGGTGVILGTPVGAPDSVNGGHVLVLTPTSFVLSEGGTTSTGAQQVYAGTVDGTTAEIGLPLAVGQPSPNAIAGPWRLNATQFLLTGGLGSPYILTVNGTGVSLTVQPKALSIGLGPGGTTVIGQGGGSPIAVNPPAVLSDQMFMFVDNNVSIYQESSSGQVSAPIGHQYFSWYWLFALSPTRALASIIDNSGVFKARVINVNPSNSGPIGFVAAAASPGDNVTVTTSGIASGFTGLTPGANYYHNGDGTITLGNTGRFAGVALAGGQSLLMAPLPMAA